MCEHVCIGKKHYWVINEGRKAWESAWVSGRVPRSKINDQGDHETTTFTPKPSQCLQHGSVVNVVKVLVMGSRCEGFGYRLTL